MEVFALVDLYAQEPPELLSFLKRHRTLWEVVKRYRDGSVTCSGPRLADVLFGAILVDDSLNREARSVLFEYVERFRDGTTVWDLERSVNSFVSRTAPVPKSDPALDS